jgi:hypothetical protein
LLKIAAVGRKYASLIEAWQKRAHFGAYSGEIGR